MTVQSARAEGWQLENDSAEAYERYLATAFSPWADALTAAAGLKAGERALDVACGTGIVARHAARRVGAGGTVAGLDVNDAMLTVARAATAGSQPPIEWRQGDAASLPFPDRYFDAVFCEQAMQFFPEPLKALRQFERQLYTLKSWNIISVVNAMVRAWASSMTFGPLPCANSVNRPPG